jgi:hypothetical protein
MLGLGGVKITWAVPFLFSPRPWAPQSRSREQTEGSHVCWVGSARNCRRLSLAAFCSFSHWPLCHNLASLGWHLLSHIYLSPQVVLFLSGRLNLEEPGELLRLHSSHFV